MNDPKHDKLKEENYWMLQYEIAVKEDHERLRRAIEEMDPDYFFDDDEDYSSLVDGLTDEDSS
jgi:hypothetical protein